MLYIGNTYSTMILLRLVNYLNILLFTIFFIFATFLPANAENLTVSGCSISVKRYLTDLAKEYERRTGVKVSVRSSDTIGGGEDLRTGKVDFDASGNTPLPWIKKCF